MPSSSLSHFGRAASFPLFLALVLSILGPALPARAKGHEAVGAKVIATAGTPGLSRNRHQGSRLLLVTASMATLLVGMERFTSWRLGVLQAQVTASTQQLNLVVPQLDLGVAPSPPAVDHPPSPNRFRPGFLAPKPWTGMS